MVKNKKIAKLNKKSKNVNKFIDSEFLFDDCVICQGMKKVEEIGKVLDVNDLKKLFKKANKKTIHKS